MDYVVIPSYNRVNVLKNSTMKFLESHNILYNMIYIFVVREEYDLYKDAFPLCNVIIGRKGLCDQRNFISEYFSEGSKVLSIDDDIKDIICLKDNKITTLNNFVDTVSLGFKMCEEVNCSLFGFYPVVNKMFMKNSISYDFKFIIGSCFGFINRKIVRTISEKDDYEFSILNYINDKKVIRFNYISIKTNYYKTKGGLQSFDNRLSEQEKAVNYLLEKYPDYLALRTGRKSGFPELRIRKISV